MENVEICHWLNSEELHRHQVAVLHKKNITSLKVPTQWKFFPLDYYSFMIQWTHYFLDFNNISCIFSCNIPEDPIFTTVYFFDMKAVRIRNGKASTTINSILMDNSIRKTPKEPCLPLAPLFDSLEGHHWLTQTPTAGPKGVWLRDSNPF